MKINNKNIISCDCMHTPAKQINGSDTAEQRCVCDPAASRSRSSNSSSNNKTHSKSNCYPPLANQRLVFIVAAVTIMCTLSFFASPIEAGVVRPASLTAAGQEEALLGRLLTLMAEQHHEHKRNHDHDHVANALEWRGRQKNQNHNTNNDNNNNNNGDDDDVDVDVDDEVVIDVDNDIGHYDVPHYHHLRRRHHRKRHGSYLYVQDHLEASASNLEWSNPCGGVFEPERSDSESLGDASDRIPARYFLEMLRNTTKLEYFTLKENLNGISLRDFSAWQNHRQHYKFLPTLKRNSSVALKRWYRHTQIFIGVFAHLGRTQLKWERSKQLPTSNVSLELNELLLSARRILCEIESVINGSYPNPNTSREKLTVLSRNEMNQKLTTLLTKDHEEAYTPDLKFSKHRYYNFLAKMSTILTINLQKRQLQHISNLNSNAVSVESSAQNSMGEDMVNESVSSIELIRSNNAQHDGSMELRSGRKRLGQKQRRSKANHHGTTKKTV